MPFDTDRLAAADRVARHALLQHRSPEGLWAGEPAPSVAATALAVVGLALQQQERSPPRPYDKFLADGVAWIAGRQQADGGWSEAGPSALSVTVLCRAALHVAEADRTHPEALPRAVANLEPSGTGRRLATALQALCAEGTFGAPVLGVAALAGLIPWSAVPAQPFERTCVSSRWGMKLRVPVVAVDLPSFVAVGLAVQVQRPPWNPLARWVRHLLRDRALTVLQAMQAEDGGFFGSVAVTAGILAHLSVAGEAKHAVARAAARFLGATVRTDGAWPDRADAAGLLTPLAIDALMFGGESASIERQAAVHSWLVRRQVGRRHPVLDEEPGGWAASEPPCAVPDGWHTAHALLALARTATFVADEQPHPSPRAVVRCNLADFPEAAAIVAQLPRLPDVAFDDRRPIRDGLTWLLAAQNDDGGWPVLPALQPTHPLHDGSPETTALALRALAAWQPQSDADQLYAEALAAARQGDRLPGFPLPDLDEAIAAGLAYLAAVQDEEGAWPSPDSSVRTTALVLLAFRDLAALAAEPARLGLAWLATAQNADGGWGAAPQSASRLWETASVVRVLADAGADHETAYQRGLAWLVQEIEAGRLTESTDYGSPPDLLWRRDPLIPIIFAAAALGRARVRASSP